MSSMDGGNGSGMWTNGTPPNIALPSSAASKASPSLTLPTRAAWEELHHLLGAIPALVLHASSLNIRQRDMPQIGKRNAART